MEIQERPARAVGRKIFLVISLCLLSMLILRFHDLIGEMVEIYIDDVVVKSMSAGGHLEDLRKVLERTRKFGLKMNPKKCAFGVSAGQFLGFLVHERGIEIGLKSQEAVKTMKPPTTKKELQKLIGKINFVR